MTMLALSKAQSVTGDLKIARVDVYKLKLPYKAPVKFGRVTEDASEIRAAPYRR